MDIINKSVEELIPYINNPRENDQAVDAVASSIKNFGFKVPIMIDKKNEIVNGHTRLKAAKKLGMGEVPTIIADDLTDEQIKAFRLADNKVGEIAEWDEDALAIELEELENLNMDMSQFGFETFDNDIDIDDLFLDDEEQLEKDNAIYLKWDNKKTEIEEETFQFLNDKLEQYKKAETNKEGDFIQWLLNNQGVATDETNVSGV